MEFRIPAMTLFAAAALVFGPIGTASADTGISPFVNANTGRCIDDSAQYGLRSFGCNNQNYQQWKWILKGNYVVFQNQNTARCMDDSAPYGLRSFGCNGQDYQEWDLVWDSSHQWYALKNVHTGRCVDDSAPYGLRSFGCNGENYQGWNMG